METSPWSTIICERQAAESERNLERVSSDSGPLTFLCELGHGNGLSGDLGLPDRIGKRTRECSHVD